jgi:Fur family transcriptional regulator, zinc uptake regulator
MGFMKGPSPKVVLVNAAKAHCVERGLRFTPPREYVLSIIACAKKPIGAYDILEALSKKMPNPKPPTVYRAIEFLEEQGFVHRIESLNAYVVCGVDHWHAGSQFLVCDSCGGVEEAHLCHVPEALSAKIHDAGFSITRWNAEIHGLCRRCQA